MILNIECSFNSKNNKWTPNLITDKDVSSINQIRIISL